jgi:DNA-binding PadR family transcriptional regulator
MRPGLAVGLLLKNGFVRATRASDPGTPNVLLYRITPEGKKLLAESVRSDDRIR